MKFYKLAIVVLFVWGCAQYGHAQNDYIVVDPGSTVHLLAEPDEYPEYVWFHDGQMIPGESTAALAANLEGFYSVFALNAGGCPSDFSDEFEVIFGMSPPTGPEDQVFCVNSYVTISDIEVQGEHILWYTAATGGNPLDPNHQLSSGVYYASQTINGVETSERFKVMITMVDCSDLLFIRKTVNNEYPLVGSEVVFTITVHNNSSLTLTDIVVEEALPSGYFYISSVASHGMYNHVMEQWIIPELLPLQRATLDVKVLVLENGKYLNRVYISSSRPDDPDDDDFAEAITYPRCLKVYNEFSPNGDGKNDLFKIECIEDYRSNRLRIYNRWGHLVYEKSPYDNSWDGTTMRETATIQRGEKLPTGTYYYSLELGNGSKPIISWLYLLSE